MAKRKSLYEAPAKSESFTWTDELSSVFIEIMTNIGADAENGFKNNIRQHFCILLPLLHLCLCSLL